MTEKRRTLEEVGALLGHANPEAFAENVLNPCVHARNHFYDDEPCPEPCGRTHLRCCSCFAPLPESECLILEQP